MENDVSNYPKNLDLNALFIGDKAENGKLYKALLNKLVDEHLGWRKNYMPQDKNMISPQEQNSPKFKKTVARMKTVLDEVSNRIRAHSVPWHSAGRYWGHMNSETLMPALLAYNYAMLWNGNNVAYESSPGTSQMEEDVGHEFARMMGYKHGWGHITCDGSIANLEGLWYARNIKSLPLAMKKVAPNLVKGLNGWQLLNMPTEKILDLFEKSGKQIDKLKAASARSGKGLQKLGKWLVPQTKHYSWLKAADIIGIGLDQVVSIPVNNHFRMDIHALKDTIEKLATKHIPILGVVAVTGTTEEGAVDEVDKVVKLRHNLYKSKGIYFYIHVDAAYGGYVRTMFLDKNNNFIPYHKLPKLYQKYGVFTENKRYIKPAVYNAYKAFGHVESITVDPHKMGYVPYAAGGIAIKDIRMRDSISYFAPYVFEKGANIPALLGAYILEGSKAGATAAAVWAANHVLPLNITGYGKLQGASIESAHRYYDFLERLDDFKVDGHTIEVRPLINPDFNMVDYVLKDKGNNSLSAMNKLNEDFYNEASYVKGGLYDNKYIVSHTDFAKPDYGNSPEPFVESLGISRDDWNRVGKVTIIRASVMTPYMNKKANFDYFAPKIKAAIQNDLQKIFDNYTKQRSSDKFIITMNHKHAVHNN